MPKKSPPLITHEDSIWDVEHQCYVMSNKSIMAFAQLCLENGDASSMEALLMELGGVQYNENCTQQVLNLVLTQDAVDIANSCFSLRDIQEWSDANTDRLIGHCPKLFAQWYAPAVYRVGAIAGFLSQSEDSEKCSILEGRSLARPAQLLYTLLKDDASLWQEFPVSWIGEKGSVLRATASAAGWLPEMLPSMLRGWLWKVDTWGNVFDYPLALCLVNDAMAILDYNESKAKGREVAHHSGRLADQSAFLRLVQLQCSAEANPVDLVLAEIIFQRVPMGYILEKSPTVLEVSLAARKQLTQLVDMYLALGSLHILLEALSRDTLPDVQEKMESIIELPELDSPTH